MSTTFARCFAQGKQRKKRFKLTPPVKQALISLQGMAELLLNNCLKYASDKPHYCKTFKL